MIQNYFFFGIPLCEHKYLQIFTPRIRWSQFLRWVCLPPFPDCFGFCLSYQEKNEFHFYTQTENELKTFSYGSISYGVLTPFYNPVKWREKSLSGYFVCFLIKQPIYFYKHLPVSMRSRPLLLRFRSFRSLTARKSLGLSCVMLLKDRSIFTMLAGMSAGTLFSPGHKRDIKLGNKSLWKICFIVVWCFLVKVCTLTHEMALEIN